MANSLTFLGGSTDWQKTAVSRDVPLVLRANPLGKLADRDPLTILVLVLPPVPSAVVMRVVTSVRFSVHRSVSRTAPTLHSAQNQRIPTLLQSTLGPIRPFKNSLLNDGLS